MKFITGEEGEQGSPAWHELRRTKIGASSSPALLGLSPYKNASDIYREMVLGEVGYINKAMANGSNTEEEARDYFNRINPAQGDAYTFKPAVVVSEECDIMMASLDGINGSNSVILEIKVPGEKVYEACLQEKIPVHWEYQIQHQLAVTGLDLAILFIYRNPTNNLILRYTRDDKRIAEIVEACQQFEKDHLSTYIAPESKKTVYHERDDDEWEDAVTSYLQFKRQRVALEEAEKVFYKKILDLAEGKPTKGCGIRIERSEPKGLVDYSLIPELEGIDLSQYRKPSKIQWRVCEIKN